jgi:ABC-2 type transport system permease protein
MFRGSAHHEFPCDVAILFFKRAFPVDGLPAPLKLLVHLNPLSYGIDGLRGVLSHAFLFGQAIDFVILGGVTAILLGVGSYLFSRIQL